MIRAFVRCGVGVGLLAVLLARVPAADPPKKEPPPAPPAAPPPAKDEGDPFAKDYRKFFKEPKTTEDYWTAIQFEIELGKYDLAAKLLRALLEKQKPTDDELVKLEEKDGMAAFLKLRTIPQWSDDPKADEQAKKDVSALIQQVRDAVKKKLTDPERLKLYVKNLNGSPEESEFALRELYRSGPEVVPYLVERLQDAKGGERANLLDALRRLARNKEVLPPLYAALDIDDPLLQADLIDVFRRAPATGAVPYLWRLAAPGGNEAVRDKAVETIGYLLDTPSSKLEAPKAVLTRQAERYYLHQVSFADPKAVTVWRYDPAAKKLVRGWPGAEVVTADQAEEYYGLRYAKEALAIDPTYRPAQILLLSLALDKAAAAPPAKGAPSPQELLETANPEVVSAVLERALAEQRTPVILATVKALGGLAEQRAGKSSAHVDPPLVQALFYPDRRVQFFAADALLHLPGPPSPQATTRIVDILRRSLAADPAARSGPKVLVGYFDDEINKRVVDAVTKAGYEAVPVRTGKDVLRRLNEAADIDLLLLDEALPDPGLAATLAQLRADLNAAPLPLVLTAKLDREEAVRGLADRYRNVTVIPFGLALDVKELTKVLHDRLADGGPPLAEAEMRDFAEWSVRWLRLLAAGDPAGYDVRPAAEAVYAALRAGKLSEPGQLDAILIVGRLPDGKAQTELANVVMDDRRPAKLRVAATQELVRHVQQHGALLAPAQVTALDGLYAKAADPDLKASLALLQGALRPDAKLTGERLLKYNPPPPGPPAPPKEPPKEPPPKDK
jgi:CheY-like chemotaxis protein